MKVYLDGELVDRIPQLNKDGKIKRVHKMLARHSNNTDVYRFFKNANDCLKKEPDPTGGDAA